VVVDYRDGWPNPLQFITDIRASRQPEFSQITALVILARCQDANELSGIQGFLSISTVHAMTAKITSRAQAILDSLTPPCGLTADDAIVAATAIQHKLPLYALDPSKFATIAGLTVIKPY
jgi:predicted nucleic acid-binding protein